MNWAQAAPFIILAAVLTVPGWHRLLRTLRAARRARHEDRARTETPAPAAADSVRMDARPVPGNLPRSIYGRCTMAVFFYDTGITVTWDHTRRRRLIDVPPVDEWDGCGFLKDTAP